LALGVKTAIVAKLRGDFVVFFLGCQNRNFVKVRGEVCYQAHFFFGRMTNIILIEEVTAHNKGTLK